MIRKSPCVFSALVSLACTLLAVAACGSDDDAEEKDPAKGPDDELPETGPDDELPETRPETTGAACLSPTDCYPDVDPEAIQGEIRCLDRVHDGYCTHLCETDDDCCAVEGECTEGIREVCSPFESTDERMCFLSCEKEDVGQNLDESEYCQQEAGVEFLCRSSGGGSDNRKVCVPGDCGALGTSCAGDGDCEDGLYCLTEFDGGYCSALEGCTANADCPEGAVCAAHPNGSHYCYATCERDANCRHCRWGGNPLTCTADVDLVEPGDIKVCEPETP